MPCIIDTLILAAIFIVVWIIIEAGAKIAEVPLNPKALRALAAIAFLIVALNLVMCVMAGEPHYWFYRLR